MQRRKAGVAWDVRRSFGDWSARWVADFAFIFLSSDAGYRGVYDFVHY
jgi:hypothetical protein